MTTMTKDRPVARPGRRARTSIRRPAAGIAIEPARLTWWRDFRAMSRQDLSRKLAALWLAEDPDAIPFIHLTTIPEDGHRASPSLLDLRHCTVCGGKIRGGLTRDAIAKFENPDPEQRRRPKASTVRALCAALSSPDRVVRPGDLLPGGPPLVLSAEARDRQSRLDYNDGMREFADALGRPELYRNPAGRIFYTRELKDMYDRWLIESGTGTGEPAAMAS